MRQLAQPKVLLMATIASLATALACCPRLSFWSDRPASIWFLEAIIFLCSIVLWGFVFAWHTLYTGRPVFVLKFEPKPFVVATLVGISIAMIFYFFIDPALRPRVPEEYPSDLKHWFAQMLFFLFFNQLFLLFAPFAWLMRLLKRLRVATALTVLFGVFLMTMKYTSIPSPVPSSVFAAMLAGRVVIGFLTVWLYLRGGVLLIWWWSLLLEARLLPDLAHLA